MLELSRPCGRSPRTWPGPFSRQEGVAEFAADPVQLSAKTRMGERHVDLGPDGEGRRGPLVEGDGLLVGVHGGGVEQPGHLRVSLVDGPRPPAGPGAWSRVYLYRAAGTGRPVSPQVQEPGFTDERETREPWLAAPRAHGAAGLEHLGDAGLYEGGGVGYPALLVHPSWIGVVIEAGGGERPEPPELVPPAGVIAAPEVEPEEERAGGQRAEVRPDPPRLFPGGRVGELRHPF